MKQHDAAESSMEVDSQSTETLRNMFHTPQWNPIFDIEVENRDPNHEAHAPAMLVTGPPRCGKTTLALAATQRAMDVFGESNVVLAVSNRVLADQYSPSLIRYAGVSTQARPATTLNALAFRLITDARRRSGLPLPKLLNGAEQDALLRRILEVHLTHVRAGEMCSTCYMLRDYFADQQWALYVTDPQRESEPLSSESLLTNGVNSAFTAQLRDMLARMDEAGATHDCERAVLASLDNTGITGGRLSIQWRLAFALRAEYIAMIREQYPEEYRLDASYLQIAGAHIVGESDSHNLPAMVVIDDFQDITLAGFALLEALHNKGVRLILIGNPDESVQTFRGSYPEYLYARAHTQLHATQFVLPYQGNTSDPDLRHLVAARVSLSIESTEIQDQARPARPGKLPAFAGAWPITALDAQASPHNDNSLKTALYRSDREEIDDVVWQIKTAHLQDGQSWNDMAVIMHDNSAIRVLGERLRRDGVPVRFSSVTRPLAEEPFVQALFALIELAQLRNDGIENRSMSMQQAASFIRSRVRMITASPLLDNTKSDNTGMHSCVPDHPMDMGPIDAAMRSLQSLVEVAPEGNLAQLNKQWQSLQSHIETARATQQSSAITVDDSIMHPEQSEHLDFGVDALYIMLAQDGSQDVLNSIEQICGTFENSDDTYARYVSANAPSRRFVHLWKLIDELSTQLQALHETEPQFALEAAWNVCRVAHHWQREAIFNTPAGRAANDRLDTAMRLFEYARSHGVAANINAFIEQVRSLEIEADSLAKLAPIDTAVTLTTPAGAAGHTWERVWMPGVQQDVWPNLAARNTMFGGEDLVDILLHGMLNEQREQALGMNDIALRQVLASEQKSFLVALTRANTTVTLSAVLNDDTIPSDFLYNYIPEYFDRERDSKPEKRRYTQLGDGVTHALDADVRGLIALARTVLATHDVDSEEAQDAVEALAVLAAHGYPQADPSTWPFVMSENDGQDDVPSPTVQQVESAQALPAVAQSHEVSHTFSASSAVFSHHTDPFHTQSAHVTAPDISSVVTLSPSKVDQLWSCPVCARMDQQFFGPSRSNVAQNFGTLIHDVAQQAHERGLDAADYAQSLGRDERVAQVTDEMFAIYADMREDPEDIEDVEQRYKAFEKDDAARETLGHIAAYFVDSNLPDQYEIGSTSEFEVGTLIDAQVEIDFTALFSLADITAAYNAIDGITPVSVEQMMALMGVLVGGWPEGMTSDLIVRLVGRMDRKEIRQLADGSEVTRLIDYKTGRPHTPSQHFQDLQLVCYQLATAFPQINQSDQSSRIPLADMPLIAQSALFDVEHASAPANSGKTAEVYFQEPLFRDGSINTHAFTRRMRIPELGKVFSIALPEGIPEGVDEQVWQELMDRRGTLTLWSLTMIARVFYAAAASRAESLQAHPEKEHQKHCWHQALCPACAGRIATVFETREG